MTVADTTFNFFSTLVSDWHSVIQNNMRTLANEDEKKIQDYRTTSVILRTVGVIASLQAFLIVNPMIGRYGFYDWPQALFRLTLGGFVASVGHDSIVVGEALRFKLEAKDSLEKIGSLAQQTFSFLRKPSNIVSLLKDPTQTGFEKTFLLQNTWLLNLL